MVVVLITATMAVVYVLLIRSQGNSPLPWVLALLGIAVGLAAYAAHPRAAFGPAALAVAGVVLVMMGCLGIFSIGVPLLVAGTIAIVSSWTRILSR